MGDIDWQTMWRLFYAAVEMPSDERSAFVVRSLKEPTTFSPTSPR